MIDQIAPQDRKSFCQSLFPVLVALGPSHYLATITCENPEEWVLVYANEKGVANLTLRINKKAPLDNALQVVTTSAALPIALENKMASSVYRSALQSMIDYFSPKKSAAITVNDKLQKRFPSTHHLFVQIKTLANQIATSMQAVQSYVDSNYIRILQEATAAQSELVNVSAKTVESYGQNRLRSLAPSLTSGIANVHEEQLTLSAQIEAFEIQMLNRYRELEQKEKEYYLFKQIIISALYNAAHEIYLIETKRLKSASPTEKEIALAEFNLRFTGVAFITPQGISPAHLATQSLSSLSLAELEKLISNQDKNNLGLLQCWDTDVLQSNALEILNKHLLACNTQIPVLYQVEQLVKTKSRLENSSNFNFAVQAYQYEVRHREQYESILTSLVKANNLQAEKLIREAQDVLANTNQQLAAIKKTRRGIESNH